MLNRYQRQDAFLQRLNPVVKLAVLFAVIAVMIMVENPWTALVLTGIAAVLLRLAGGVTLSSYLLLLLPFTLFALGFLWIHAFFPAERGETILVAIGTLVIAQENVYTGLVFAARALLFASWSLWFVLTTDPVRLMLALIQNCRLPVRYGYGIMAAYRFMPLLADELRQIRAAHRIRGFREQRGVRGRWQRMKRYALPLLASAVRKAERVAVAMEAKGFDDRRDRVFYRKIGFSAGDVLFGGCIGLLLLFVLITA